MKTFKQRSELPFLYTIFVKVASVFFGCAALTPTSAEVVCTNKIEKLTKGVDCAVRVPLGTKATFSCLNTFTLSENYKTVQCKFPGKWLPSPPKCISAVQVEPLDNNDTATSPAPNVTTTKTTAAVVTITTTVPKNNTTTPVGLPAVNRPVLVPVASKRYDNVGLLTLYDKKMDFNTARNECAYRNSKLMYLESPAAQVAAVDLLATSPDSGLDFNMALDPVRDPATNVFSTSSGVPIASHQWCPQNPSLLAGEFCTALAHTPGTAWMNCEVDCQCTQESRMVCREP